MSEETMGLWSVRQDSEKEHGEETVEETKPVLDLTGVAPPVVEVPPVEKPVVPLTPPEGYEPRRGWSTASEVVGSGFDPLGQEIAQDTQPASVDTSVVEIEEPEVEEIAAEAEVLEAEVVETEVIETEVVEVPAPPAPPIELPEGTVDLTGETPIITIDDTVEDSVRVPESVYADDEGLGEPVHGTVEVDQLTSQPTQTIIMPTDSLDDHRAARARALGEVDPGADVYAAPAVFQPPAMYKPWPSFVLFIVRLIIAAILSIRATQELLNLTDTKALWGTTILAYPDLWAICVIIVEYIIAAMLVLGLATRAAGIALSVLFIVVLSFLIWGSVNPFESGVVGFRGELEVLFVCIGFIFAGVGGGGAAVDGAIHRARLERKNARLVQEV